MMRASWFETPGRTLQRIALTLALSLAARGRGRGHHPPCGAEDRNVRLGAGGHPRRTGSTSKPIFRIDVTELASPEAGKIALRAGNADIIVSDWLWVSRERGLGAKLDFYPYSSALGAVMVPASSPIKTLADLKGRKLARRRRPDRQELAAAAGADEAGRHRPEVGGEHRLWRAAAARRQDARRRDGRHAQLLEFLRRSSRPRAFAASPASRTSCRSSGPRARIAHGRLCLRRELGRAPIATRWRASSR